MKELFISGLQIALSMWEIWICYKFLQCMIHDNSNKGRIDKILMLVNIIIVGVLLGQNRIASFFSRAIFFFVVLLTIIFVCVKGKQRLLKAGLITVFFSSVAVLDMVCALFCLDFFRDNFMSIVYVYAATWEKTGIFLFTRMIAYIVVLFLRNKVKDIYMIAEQCKYVILGFGVLFCGILIKYQSILLEMVEGSRKTDGINASITLVFMSFVTVLIVLFLFKYQFIKQENEAILLREKLLEERYVEMVKSRKIVHDMKNHLLLLKQYEKEQRWEELHDYLEEIGEGLLDSSTKIWTGNATVDLILNSKKIYAERQGITVEIQTEVIVDFSLTNRELLSIFGNLLDNAIEACQGMESSKKWISINIHKQNCLLYIEVENSIAEKPIERKGYLVSSKMDIGIHGYGMKNVKQIVERYDGLYSYHIKENSFITKVAFFDDKSAV